VTGIRSVVPVEAMINPVVKGMVAKQVMNVDPKEYATLVAHICLVKEINATRDTTTMMSMGYVIGTAI
jgi:hypothetical protein